MRTKILCVSVMVLFCLFNKTALAQAPTISYSSTVNTFSVGTGIGTVSPTLGGGSVPSSPVYANVTTISSGTTNLISNPGGIVCDATGTYLYSVNSQNNKILRTTISTGAVIVIAGTGSTGSADNVNGASATFSSPMDVAYDGSAYLYVADYNNNRIRRISTTSPYAVTTLAGSATSAETDGTGILAAFNKPRGIIYDQATSSLYVCDFTGGKIRKITVPGAVVTTIATIPSAANIAADGTNFYVTTLNTASVGGTIIKIGAAPGYSLSTFAGNAGLNGENDGIGTGAIFNSPTGITYDNLLHCLYVADGSGNVIRKVSVPGAVVTTLAGSGSAAETNGLGIASAFNGPFGITSNNKGSLYTTDYGGSTIRPINIIGYSISPLLPAGLSFNTSTGAITGTPTLSSGQTTYTITATNASGSTSTSITIQVTAATPSSIYYSPSKKIYTVNTAITSWSPTNTGCIPASSPGYGNVSTLMASAPYSFNQVCDGAGNLWVADYNNGQIKKISISSGTVTATIGTTGSGEVDGNGAGTGTLAQFNHPVGIAYDGIGYLYIADMNGAYIRKVSTTYPYVVITIAGNGTTAERDGSGLTGAGSAEFSSPHSIVYDRTANCLYVLDVAGGANAGTLRKVDLTTSPATVSTLTTGLKYAYGLAYDGANFYVTTYSTGNTVLKILGASPYTASVFAGNASTTESDGTGTAAGINAPAGIYYDKSGYLYVTDYNGATLRKISVSGAVVTTVAGKAATSAETNGLPVVARFTTPCGITSDNAGNLYVIDQSTQTIRTVNLVGYTISPTLPAGLSMDPGTGVISGTPTAAILPTAYTVTDYCSSGSSSSTNITIGVGVTYDWVSIFLLGGTTAWNTSSNWYPVGVPGPSDNARIGVGLTIFDLQPKISTNVTVGSITFGHGAVLVLSPKLTIAASSSLTVNKNFTVNTSLFGLFTVTIAGAGTGSTTSAVNIAPGGIVNINSGSLILTSPLTFTLQSNANADASIGQLASATSIIGTINVQRYLSANRGYRLLSSPVYAGSITSGSNTFNRYSINYLKDSTLIQGTNASGGFNRTWNPTIYIYRENIIPLYNAFTNSDFRGINNITASPSYTLDLDGAGYSIPVTNGYLLYFVGGLSTPTPWATGSAAVAATLNTSGTINTGQIPFTLWYTPGSTGLSYTASTAPTAQPGTNLIGNPYPSAINWDTFQVSSTGNGVYGSHVDSTIWVLDPTTQNYGAYIAGNSGVGSANYATNIISSGQGFFVHANTTGAQLIFNESAKTALYNPSTKTVLNIPKGSNAKNLLMDIPAYAAQPVVTTPIQYLRLQIGQNGVTTYEQTMVHFKNGVGFAYNPNKDALYKTGYGAINIATIGSTHASLAINTIPYPSQKDDTIKLAVSAKSDGIYQLTLTDMVNIPQMYDIWLKDNYKKDSLDIKHNPAYSFNLYRADTSSYGSNRFSLIVRKNPAYGYRLLNFTANRVINKTQVLVTWKTENEGNSMSFIVQRSTNGGKSYTIIDSLQGTNAGLYAFTDVDPVNGTNMYRLKQVGENNTVSYSKVVSVIMINLNNLNKNMVSIYPNPGKDLTNISIDPSAQSAAYDIKFINSWGVIKKQFTTTQLNWSGSIANLETGIYVIQVSAGANLIGEGKFIKQ